MTKPLKITKSLRGVLDLQVADTELSADLCGYTEVFYDVPELLPGHSHIITDLVVWTLMERYGLTAEDALEAAVLALAARVPLDPDGLARGRPTHAVTGHGHAAGQVPPVPGWLVDERDRMRAVEKARAAGLVLPGEASRGAG